ncbi:MAG: SMC-Scp complex subunit ScpB, partial [Alphaproteobacteria bacterium]
RPTLWGTTPKFLEQFSLKSLADLPRKEELVTGDAPPLPGLNAPVIPDEAEEETPPPTPEAAEEASER